MAFLFVGVVFMDIKTIRKIAENIYSSFNEDDIANSGIDEILKKNGWKTEELSKNHRVLKKGNDVLEINIKSLNGTGFILCSASFNNSEFVNKRSADMKEITEHIKKTMSHKIRLSNDLRSKIIDFFNENPNPPDTELHKWAEKQGLEPSKAEEVAYQLATSMSVFLKSGRANEKSYKEEDADPKEVSLGIEIEAEHTPEINIRKRITLDHLSENPKSPLGYNTGLKLLEKFMESLVDDPKAKERIEEFKKLVDEKS